MFGRSNRNGLEENENDLFLKNNLEEKSSIKYYLHLSYIPIYDIPMLLSYRVLIDCYIKLLFCDKFYSKYFKSN